MIREEKDMLEGGGVGGEGEKRQGEGVEEQEEGVEEQEEGVEEQEEGVREQGEKGVVEERGERAGTSCYTD